MNPSAEVMEFTSPDDKIHKKLLVAGQSSGPKPYDGSVIKLNITVCSEELVPYNLKTLIVGENDGDLGRLLDICVGTMYLNERSKFTITVGLQEVSGVIELIDLQFNGFIFEWDAKKRLELAQRHKDKGAEFFKERNNYEAAYRFAKALKLVCSIPIAAEDPPIAIDDVFLEDIHSMKEKLYNNLASCYFRGAQYHLVVPLCEKVLAFDGNNAKALYKIGVAYEQDRNYEKAFEALNKLNQLEPQNKACAERLVSVKANLKSSEEKVKNLMRKMIIGSIEK